MDPAASQLREQALGKRLAEVDVTAERVKLTRVDLAAVADGVLIALVLRQVALIAVAQSS